MELLRQQVNTLKRKKWKKKKNEMKKQIFDLLLYIFVSQCMDFTGIIPLEHCTTCFEQRNCALE